MMKVRVEIHRITKLEDVGVLAKVGMGLLGFVIFESPRGIVFNSAKQIMKAVSLFVIKVVATVLRSLERILEICRELFKDMGEIFRKTYVKGGYLRSLPSIVLSFTSELEMLKVFSLLVELGGLRNA